MMRSRLQMFALAPLLAQIRPQPAPAAPVIRDIAPPLDVFPYPIWIVVLGGAVVLVVLALIAWWLIRWWRNRPSPLPPSARSIALRELEKLRAQLEQMEPYAFSIAVSDILRTFIGAHYSLHAREQTSPEFLAAIASSPRFSSDDRTLLTRFLERADMIKFARIDATSDDSRELLSSATAFVQGDRI
jgi:hypothetical protein